MRKHAGEVNIIVTHWPPTLHALHPMYAHAGSTEVLLNRYFINDKETLVHEMGATLWIEAPAAPEEPASKTTGGRDASCKHSGPRARGRRTPKRHPKRSDHERPRYGHSQAPRDAARRLQAHVLAAASTPVQSARMGAPYANNSVSGASGASRKLRRPI